jgi:hypothetical protein
MSKGIEQLTAALRRAYPEIAIEQLHASNGGTDDEGHWHINHPRALTEVQVTSSTGEPPFLVESEFAPPTLARTVDDAARLVIARLGLLVGSA